MALGVLYPERPTSRYYNSVGLPGNVAPTQGILGDPSRHYWGGSLDGWRSPATVAGDAMRKNLIKKGDEHLRYEIREIVEIANEIVRRGVPMIWENIGDPVAKGETLPAWMKAIVEAAVSVSPKPPVDGFPKNQSASPL